MRTFTIAVLAMLLLPAVAAGAVEDPRAEFTVSPQSPRQGEQVTFDASASECWGWGGWRAANCADYRWVDDGVDSTEGSLDSAMWELGSGPAMTRSFSGVGRKNVWLVLTDRAGRTTETWRPVEVAASAPPPTPSPTPEPTPSPTPEPTPSPTPTPQPPPVPEPSDCTATATTGSFDGAVNAALRSSGPYALCLADGDYGQFAIDDTKPGDRLVIRAQPGATVTMRFWAARGGNMTFEGLRIPAITSMDGGSWRNVTWRGNEFTGAADIRAASFNHNNILFDGNTHRGRTSGTLMRFPNAGANPNGVTIRNSMFVGGTSDAIQTGANGLTIVGNRFLDIRQNDSLCSACHTDVIQLIGAENTTIKANFFHNVSVPVGGFDGPNESIVIEDNVVVGVDSVNTLVVGSGYNVTVRHNTVTGSPCILLGNCGWVRLGSKDSSRPGGSIRVVDNIASKLVPEISPVAEVHHNLWADAGGLVGLNDLIGRPVFECGCTPSTYAEAKLAPGSPGYRSASDGLDRGARIP